MKTTRPKSPVTFKCLLAISSLKGTTTVQPREARRVTALDMHCIKETSASAYQVGERCNGPGSQWRRIQSQYARQVMT